MLLASDVLSNTYKLSNDFTEGFGSVHSLEDMALSFSSHSTLSLQNLLASHFFPWVTVIIDVYLRISTL